MPGAGGGAPPTISVVTPCLNREAFIEDTLRSVLDQAYDPLEYIVIDAGSTDATVDVIHAYEDRLAYWVSEPDRGMWDGLNKGFARSSGEVMAWLGSDDKYCPWTLHVVGEIFSELPEVEWLTSLFPIVWNRDGRAVSCACREGYSRRGFLRGDNLPGAGWATSSGFIQQESVFWRRSLWERAGGRLDDSLSLAGDFELWARFFEHAPLYGVATPLGGFRAHGDQKSAQALSEYLGEATRVLVRSGGGPPGRLESVLRQRVQAHLPRRFRWLHAQVGLDPTPRIVYDPQRGWGIEVV